LVSFEQKQLGITEDSAPNEIDARHVQAEGGSAKKVSTPSLEEDARNT